MAEAELRAGQATELLILGLGNVLMTDDGAGVYAVRALTSSHELPPGVRALDGGTLGLALLPHLRSSERVLLVDAIACSDAAPGTVVSITGRAAADTACERLSPHQVGVADLLFGAALLDGTPLDAVLVGIVAERIELGAELSDVVAHALPELVEAVVAQAGRLGFHLPRKEALDAASQGCRDPLDAFGMPVRERSADQESTGCQRRCPGA